MYEDVQFPKFPGEPPRQFNLGGIVGQISRIAGSFGAEPTRSSSYGLQFFQPTTDQAYADPSFGQGESDGRTDSRSASSDDRRSALEHAHLPSRVMLAIVGAVDKFCVPLMPLATQMDVGLKADTPGGFVWLYVAPQSIFVDAIMHCAYVRLLGLP
jgi:hypothetical protein